jgi:hypothetical protein
LHPLAATEVNAESQECQAQWLDRRYTAAGRAVAARRSMPSFILHVVNSATSVAQITT